MLFTMLARRSFLFKALELKRRISTTSYLASDELFVHRDSQSNNALTPFKFSEANMTRLLAVMKNYPEGAERSALSAALDLAQRQHGWVPISAMHNIADILRMPRMRVYEWATFYTMVKRHNRGKFHVKVCKTTPCMLRGSDIILDIVEHATCCCRGSLSSDGMFGVDTVECAGACANAPVVVVNDDYYEDVTPENIYTIIGRLRAGGIPPPGPQNGRFSCEPITGLTTLLECPPPPGFGLQCSLYPAGCGPCKPN